MRLPMVGVDFLSSPSPPPSSEQPESRSEAARAAPNVYGMSFLGFSLICWWGRDNSAIAYCIFGVFISIELNGINTLRSCHLQRSGTDAGGDGIVFGKLRKERTGKIILAHIK